MHLLTFFLFGIVAVFGNRTPSISRRWWNRSSNYRTPFHNSKPVHYKSSYKFVSEENLSTRSATKEDPSPLSPCKNDAENCDGIVDALGVCVCGKEIRTLGFVGTYSDSSCTEVVEELPRPKIPTEACFHLSAFYWKSLFAPKTVSIRVSCLPGNTGANFKLWNGLNCEGESVAEANVYPDQCVYGGLETFLRGRDIWVIDETCTVP